MVWQFIPMCNEQHIIGRQYNEIQSHHSHEQERERPYVNITIENRPIHRYTRPRLNHIWLSIKASPVLSFFDVIPIFLHQTPTTHSPFFLSILSLALSVSLRMQRTFMYSINRVFHYFREQSIEMRFFSTHLFYRVYIFYRRLIIADGQWFHTRKESRWQRETCLSKSERLAVGIFLPAICERTSTRIAHSLRYSQRNEKKNFFFC